QSAAEVTAAMGVAANGGADVLLYAGHGNSVHLGKTDPRLLGLDDVKQWKGDVIFLQATCTGNWIANNGSDWHSLASQGLTQPQGGLCASIGTSTYMASDAAADFMNALVKNTQGGGTMRWGSALLRTQQWAMLKNGANAFYGDLCHTEQLF